MKTPSVVTLLLLCVGVPKDGLRSTLNAQLHHASLAFSKASSMVPTV